MKAMRLTLLILHLVVVCDVVDAATSKIMSDQNREDYVSGLESIINYKDSELEQVIPYIINPFFFDQPLLLKLRAPGGVSDVDVLKSFGDVIINEVSGAFVRGSKRFLLMKSGDLLKEGDKVTRALPDLGDLDGTVTIGAIQREKFALKLNNVEIMLDLSGR